MTKPNKTDIDWEYYVGGGVVVAVAVAVLIAFWTSNHSHC